MRGGAQKMVRRGELCARMKQDAAQKKILYLGAHTGWGKTVLIHQYLQSYKLSACCVRAGQEGALETLEQAVRNGKKHLLLDDLQELEPGEENRLVELLTKSPCECRFYLLGRSRDPGFLKDFFATNQLAVYGILQLALSLAETEELAKLRGFTCTRAELERIHRLNEGWLTGILFFLRRAEEKGELTPQALELAELDIFDALDTTFWNKMDEQLQNLFLDLGHLESFTVQEARMVCGLQNVDALLAAGMIRGSFLLRDGRDDYHFTPLCQRYFLHKQRQLRSAENIRRCYENTALYFALQNDAENALKYYDLAGNRQKILELLIENSRSEIVGANYYKLEKYYLQLDPAQVDRSPDLLGALAMLHSICMRPQESDACMKKLVQLENRLPADDPRKRQVREKRAYLTLALPHHGSGNVAETLQRLTLVPSLRANLQKLSITGNMPSIMSGGLDFCFWSTQDRLMYKTLGPVLRYVFNGYANGLAEIALGESLYEKSDGDNLTECLMLLNKGQSESEKCANFQIFFAVRGLMARLFASQGSLDTAMDLLSSLRQQMDGTVEPQLRRNVEAAQVWLHLLQGDLAAAETWMASEAPNEQEHFYTLERLRYMVKIQIYLVQNRCLEALSLLDRMENYVVSYQRTYNHIQVGLLRGIALRRMGVNEWKVPLLQALHTMEKYQFIRVGADLGAALLEPLQTVREELNGTYANRLVQAVRHQAVLYPRFLAPQQKCQVHLTESEKTVLGLLNGGMTNAEIAGALGVTLATVKTHTSNLYSKLGVRNRLAAVRLAREQRLV